MSQMLRKQVYFEPCQDEIVKRLARLRGVTEAEIIRSAVDKEVGRLSPGPDTRDPTSWREAKQFIRGLIAAGPVSGKRTWKRQDAYSHEANPHGR